MTDVSRLSLFTAFGVELEYMVVDRDTLDVRPVVDEVLAAMAGEITSDFQAGSVTWSNELARHVIELKTSHPVADLQRVPKAFEKAIRDIDAILAPRGLRLLPGAMHPWMNPANEMQLWPHEYHEIYETYDTIFNCRRHGWANVQSVHLNLPFADDAEFARLHAAIRLVLPLLPALAASSPVCEGQLTGWLDTRLKMYSEHCNRVPSLTGDLIPEPIFDEATYRSEIFQRLYQDIAPLDPDGILQGEFLNARGAIGRFDRGSIEIRVLDVQEYPAADVAICAAVSGLVRALVSERWSSLAEQQQMPTGFLADQLMQTARHAERTVIDDSAWLAHFGITRRHTAGEVWAHLLKILHREDPAIDALYGPLQVITTEGTLATRITKALGDGFSQSDLLCVYGELADALRQGQIFLP